MGLFSTSKQKAEEQFLEKVAEATTVDDLLSLETEYDLSVLSSSVASAFQQKKLDTLAREFINLRKIITGK